MKGRIYGAFCALALISCSAGGPAEKSEGLSATEESAAPDNGDDAAEELAPCLVEGAIPLGATQCEFELNLDGSTEDSYWRDSDGMDPGTPGCHDEYKSDACAEPTPVHSLGEFCVDGDRLVEWSSDAGVCHSHKGDVGTPNVISCTAWCASEGHSSGRCEPFVTGQGAAGTCESARCACDQPPG